MQDNKIAKLDELGIKDKIYSIRGHQVMLDSDLAELYNVETRILNQAVKRNINRFPVEFCFKLNIREIRSLRSQFVISNKAKNTSRSQFATSKKGGQRYLPYVFTQEGIAMLAGILKSEIAVRISIQIIKAFVDMRKFLINNAQIFQRLDRVELKQIEVDQNFKKVFELIESKDIIPKQGIFFDGQIFDAYNFVSDLFKSAKESVTIIDNYVDNSVLIHLTEVKKNVKVKILIKSISRKLKQDNKKF